MEPNNEPKILSKQMDIDNVAEDEQLKPMNDNEILKMLMARIATLEKESKQAKRKHEEQINDLEFRVTINENSTSHGILKWKIHGFSVRTQEAIDNKVRAINSAPCFTSPYGYKYCIRVYPTGDGLGKDTHLTLLLVLLKSEYDATLEWPFTKKVMVTLINQEDRTKDFVKVLIPSSTSPGVQRPKNDTNTAFGFPEFFPLDKLNDGFLKDDALFIDVRFIDN